jgi:sugar lactone lactonase YvrE
MKQLFLRSLPLVALLLGACESDDETSVVAEPLMRGPASILVDGDPNGLWWDEPAQTLYIADDNGNRILKWTDRGGLSVVADLPAVADGSPGLGQLVLTADGTIVVTRFGYGTAGDVVFVPPGGEAQIVPRLDPARRRIGLTVTDDGRLFDTWFVRLDSGAREGAVSELGLDGSEADVITGLQKPVGVFASGDSLFVSEQDLGQILEAPLADPASYAVLTTIESPDLLTTWRDGSIFTGSVGGNLYRIDAEGSASVFETGFQQVRGVAYDGSNGRVFVADHDGDETDGVSHVLHILPVE